MDIFYLPYRFVILFMNNGYFHLKNAINFETPYCSLPRLTDGIMVHLIT